MNFVWSAGIGLVLAGILISQNCDFDFESAQIAV